MIKTLNKTGKEGNYINLKKSSFEKPTANSYSILNTDFPLKLGMGNKATMSPLTIPVWHRTSGSSHCDKATKRKKTHLDWKE